jgi:hypothetical protein
MRKKTNRDYLVHLHRKACAIPGSAAILAAPRAGETPALPGIAQHVLNRIGNFIFRIPKLTVV